MTDAAEEYKEIVLSKIKKIYVEEIGNIEKAVDIIVNSIIDDKLVYLFGTGHSMMLCMEMFTRAGGLVHTSPMFDLSLSGFNGAIKAAYLERLPGYAKALIDYYDPKEGSTLIVISSSGKNSGPVEMALEAKKRGLKVIALTSIEYSKSVPASNPLGKRLFEIADIVIDNKVPAGDATVELKGFKQRVASVSTILGAFVLETMVVKSVEKMLSKGLKPSVWKEPNVPGGDEFNKQYWERYFGRIKSL